MAAAFLRARLEGVDDIRVRTAGVLAGSRPMDPVAVEVLAKHGLEPDVDMSRQVRVADVQTADLILCLERRHLREVVVLHRDALPWAFTLRELVRRGEAVGPRTPGTTLGEYLERLGAGRERADLTREAPEDDVADPTGGPVAGYEHTAHWLDGLVHRAVGLLFPPGFDVEPADADRADPDAVVAGRPVALGSDDVDVQRWRRHSGPGPDGRVGITAHESAFRLARNVTHSLRAHGFDLESTSSDSWLAASWAGAVEGAVAAIEAGRIDAAIVLAASAMAPAALANRHPAVRAATPTDVSMARRARQSLGANLLCLGTEEVTASQAQDIVAVFLAVAPLVPADLRDAAPRSDGDGAAAPLAPERHGQ